MSRLHRPRAGFWIRLCVMILYPLDGLLFRIRTRHLDRIPERGGVILAVNHLSYIDTILMARMVWQSGRIPRFLIKSGIFSKPVVGAIMTGAGQIPVYRGTADAQQSLRAAAAALRAGECVVIYAEGTITHDPDYWPMQAKTGVARLALLVPEAPVVPIGQWGAQFTFDSLRRKVRPFPRKTVTVSVGEPVDLSRFAGSDPTGATLREVTDVIMTRVRDLVADIRGETPPATFYRRPAAAERRDRPTEPGQSTPGQASPPERRSA